MKLYPIKFKPILQEKIWGGDKLINRFNKESEKSLIGESWELSGVNNNLSIVENGFYENKSIIDLIEEFTFYLVGDKVYKQYGARFPLLFKFIDASDDLSIQLHPNDELAKKRHNAFGKTEMWYVLDADKDAILYAGFEKKITKEEYESSLKKGDVLSLINKEKVKRGDAFFIESGTIHGIGKGTLIAEIQQTSNVTYRVFDWNRVGLDGKERELHNDLAIEALDYNKHGSCNVKYDKFKNKPNQVLSCNYFTTNRLLFNGKLVRDYKNVDSFVVYMCVEGEVNIKLNENTESLKIGQTILIPAATEKVVLSSSEETSLLEVYI